MTLPDEEEELLRSVALQNARTILAARQRAEEQLLRSQQDLREAAERLHVALDAGKLGDWSWDAATDLVTLSERAALIFGLPVDTPISWARMRELLHDEHREPARLAVEQAIASRSDYDIEYRVTRPAGGDCWLAARGRGTYAADGKVIGMVGVVQDISARREAEDALRQSEELLRGTFEQAAVGIAIAQLDGRFVQTNQKFADILGYDRDEVLEVTFRDITHPEDAAVTNDYIRSLVAGDIADYSLEKRYLRKDRRVIWSLTSVTLIRDARGQPLRFVGVIEDVTARRKTEDALRESEQFNRTIIESSRDCIKTLSIDGKLLWISERGCKALQIDDPSNVVGNSWIELWEGEDRAAARAAVEAAAAGGTGTFIGCFTVGGQPGWWDVVVTPIRDLSGKPATLLAVSRDVSKRVQMERALRESAEERRRLFESERFARAEAERLSATKDEFLAVLSHELRTPLNAILGWAGVLRLRVSGNDEWLKSLEIIERNARVQNKLIDELLDMSRIESGKMLLDVHPVVPFSFIESAVETVRPAAAAKGIRLEVLLDRAAGPISADAGRLQQVVWNLLSNAIKFTPRGGLVHVLLEVVDSHIEITVADTGMGISPELLLHVFERFRQGDSSSTRQHGGLGLGLAIVKHLVELHGGTVRAQSPGAGLGTTFTVTLPLPVNPREALERRRDPSSAASVNDFEATNLAGVTVLVVDDESDASELVSAVLRECGAQVFSASSAEEALTLVEREKPDVLVSDIGMPGVDGFELLRRVRELGNARGGKLPAIALTAFARSEDRTRALRAGFLVHLSKPVETSDLVATIASVAGTPTRAEPGSRT